jgi:hypothetical protein
MRDMIFQHNTRDPLCCQPITYLSTFQIDGENLVTPARKYDYRSPRILSLWRLDRQGRTRDIRHRSHRAAGDGTARLGSFRLGWRMRIGGSSRP